MPAPAQPPSQTALRVVITMTLVIGAVLVGILVLRETVAPAWLRPAVAPSGTIAAEPIAPPAVPPALPLVMTPTPATSEPTLPPLVSATPPAAIEAGSAPSSSASASASASGSRRSRPTGAPPREPGVYELPDDFQYSPAGSSNLTFPR